MREILFRGKTYDGKWEQGDLRHGGYVHNDSETYIMRVDYALHNIPVDPKTVGQYTGLTDKNGVKIFEGDILNTTNSNYAIWYVDYKNTAFCCNQGNANYSCVLDEFMQYSDVEVIGNIHNTPELLEEKQ